MTGTQLHASILHVPQVSQGQAEKVRPFNINDTQREKWH